MKTFIHNSKCLKPASEDFEVVFLFVCFCFVFLRFGLIVCFKMSMTRKFGETQNSASVFTVEISNA